MANGEIKHGGDNGCLVRWVGCFGMAAVNRSRYLGVAFSVL